LKGRSNIAVDGPARRTHAQKNDKKKLRRKTGDPQHSHRQKNAGPTRSTVGSRKKFWRGKKSACKN